MGVMRTENRWQPRGRDGRWTRVPQPALPDPPDPAAARAAALAEEWQTAAAGADGLTDFGALKQTAITAVCEALPGCGIAVRQARSRFSPETPDAEVAAGLVRAGFDADTAITAACARRLL